MFPLPPLHISLSRYRFFPNRRGGVSGFGVPPTRPAAQEPQGGGGDGRGGGGRGGRHTWGEGFRLGGEWAEREREIERAPLADWLMTDWLMTDDWLNVKPTEGNINKYVLKMLELPSRSLSPQHWSQPPSAGRRDAAAAHKLSFSLVLILSVIPSLALVLSLFTLSPLFALLFVLSPSLSLSISHDIAAEHGSYLELRLQLRFFSYMV